MENSRSNITNFFLGLCCIVMLYGCHGIRCSDDTTIGIADINKLANEYAQCLQDTCIIDSLMNTIHESMICDSISSPTGNPQGLCSLTRWWVDNPYSDNATIDSLVQLFNLQTFKFSIWADYEIWLRASLSGTTPLVSTDIITAGILGIDISVFSDTIQHSEAASFRDEVVWGINHFNLLSESRNPDLAASSFDSITVNLLENKLASIDKCQVFYNVIDSMIDRYKSIQRKIASLDEGKRFSAILNYVNNAKTFDEQCGIVLACSSHSETYVPFWTTRLMHALLQSGKYSDLLGRIWILWRAFSQEELFGNSHDSCIPNCYFNKVRKEIFMTTLAHIHYNPLKRQTVISAAMLAIHPIIIRNGSNIFGNDATIDIMLHCPNFYTY